MRRLLATFALVALAAVGVPMLGRGAALEGVFTCDMNTFSNTPATLQVDPSVYSAFLSGRSGCGSSVTGACIIQFDMDNMSMAAANHATPAVTVSMSDMSSTTMVLILNISKLAQNLSSPLVPLVVTITDIHFEQHLSLPRDVTSLLSITAPLPANSSVTIRNATYVVSSSNVRFILHLQSSSSLPVNALRIDVSNVSTLCHTNNGVSLVGVTSSIPIVTSNMSISLRANILTCDAVTLGACALMVFDFTPAIMDAVITVANGSAVTALGNAISATMGSNGSAAVLFCSGLMVLQGFSSLHLGGNTLSYSAMPTATGGSTAAILLASVAATYNSTIAIERNVILVPVDAPAYSMQFVEAGLFIGSVGSTLRSSKSSAIIIANNTGVASGPFIVVDGIVATIDSTISISGSSVILLQQQPKSTTFAHVLALLVAQFLSIRVSSSVTFSGNNVSATFVRVGASAALLRVDGYVLLDTNASLSLDDSGVSVVVAPGYHVDPAYNSGSPPHSGLIVIVAKCFQDHCGIQTLGGHTSVTLFRNSLRIDNFTSPSIALLAVHQFAEAVDSRGLQNTTISLADNTWAISGDVATFAIFGLLGTDDDDDDDDVPLDLRGLNIALYGNNGTLASLVTTPAMAAMVLLRSSVNLSITQSTLSVTSCWMSVNNENTTCANGCVLSAIAIFGLDISLEDAAISVSSLSLDVHTRRLRLPPSASSMALAVCGGMYFEALPRCATPQ